ncbi:endolytic transglycosylase MltG [Thiohalomonas denitrificans]|uniref:endolytic transglycosylase MltG n=1 Tax=Thiohalomonas denitrificans TaxID=415747 RepID=UPI0026F2D4EE|nr:endolytic transglycosylase MltG [Thiohalomonas denitrificans]
MRQLLFKFLGLTILTASLFGGWQLVRYQNFVEAPLNIDDEGIDIRVAPGTPLSALAARLEKQGVISDDRLLVWMARIKDVAADIKAGEYHVEPDTTPPQLLQQMVKGRAKQYSLTLVEGWTFFQVMDAIHGNPYLEQTLTDLDPEAIMERLGLAEEHPEGQFLSDSYSFPRGTKDVDFLRRAHREMQSYLAAAWDERDEGLPFETPYEALILASIIEKETGVPEERAAIGGVFVRRLNMGMRLQTDPTIIYGLGEEFDGNLRRVHLNDSDNPYNTYRHSGLPPTPIAMPGREAIDAALHPADGKSLYFVSRGDGSHVFSATLEEHNQAVIKYQLKGRARTFSSSP